VSAAAVVTAGLLAGVAGAKLTPAWSYLSKPLRTELAAKSGDVLYLPARTPLFYRYRSGAKVSRGVLSVTYTNRVRIRQGLWRWTKQTFLWQVEPLRAGTQCVDWAPFVKSYQVGGNKVLWSDAKGGEAWRCVLDKHGKSHVLVASHGTKIAAVGLAIVVASGLDVSGRR
jgi:hypothetical protein